MKPLLANAAANSLTCHVREADANWPNLLPYSSPHLPANRPIPDPVNSLLLIRIAIFAWSTSTSPSAAKKQWNATLVHLLARFLEGFPPPGSLFHH
jgi:hypothetical protein